MSSQGQIVLAPVSAPSVVTDGTFPMTSVVAPIMPVVADSNQSGSNNELTIMPYNDSSFVVRGNITKKYKGNLGQIGGKWNRFLNGGGGWIFSNSHRDTVDKMVEEIKTGTLAPIPYERKVRTNRQFGYQNQMQMQVQPVQAPGFGYQQPVMQSYGQQMPMPMPMQQNPNFQTVTWNVFRPSIGMNATIRFEGQPQFVASVVQVQNTGPFITTVFLQYNTNGQQQMFEAGIWNGQWQLRNMPAKHGIFFQ